VTSRHAINVHHVHQGATFLVDVETQVPIPCRYAEAYYQCAMADAVKLDAMAQDVMIDQGCIWKNLIC
jgi:hypothetical protein